eukprot:jgi/Tetstr1/449147/TSEL_036357.t1
MGTSDDVEDGQSLLRRYPSLVDVLIASSISGGGSTAGSGSGPSSSSVSEVLMQYKPLVEAVGTGSDTSEGPLPETYPAKEYLGPGQGCFASGSEVLKDHVNYESFIAEESRYDHITKLMARAFKVPICHICLLCNDRVWFRSTIMSEATGAFQDRCYAWCNYVMIPTEPEVLITENAHADGRFTRSPYVVGEPYLKFYAGAPLVGTGGRRYGTLCVIDFVPRTFTAELYHMLVNFAELTCQELEKDWDLMAEWTSQAVSDARNRHRLRASLSTATHGVAMIDTRLKAWSFLYANEMFYNISGIGSAGGMGADEELLLESGLWDTFAFATMADDEVAKGISQGGTVTTLCRCKRTGATLRLSLRPACTDQLSPGKPVGVPSWVPSERDRDDILGVDVEAVRVSDTDPELCRDVERCFYFVVLQPVVPEMRDSVSSLDGIAPLAAPSTQATGGRTPKPRLSASSSSDTPWPVATWDAHGSADNEGIWRADGSEQSYGDFAIPEDLRRHLKIGTMIGSGCFGKVYRGRWRGVTVAVKVIEAMTEASVSMAEAEAQLGLKFDNPHLVKTVLFSKQATQHQRLIRRGVTTGVPTSVMFVVQEFCDCGTLNDAVERAWLRTRRDVTAPPHWVHMLMTLLEIAMGMEYLHSKGIVHCDLNGRNVMLQCCSRDSRGFTAKVCDFGMSRVCHGPQPIAKCFGTTSHMAPEQLADQPTLGSEVDVWAFGVTMWEMATGKRALIGRTLPEIVMISRSLQGHSFILPEGTPLDYRVLLSACLQKQPRDRPTFSSLVPMLRHALREAMMYTVEQGK